MYCVIRVRGDVRWSRSSSRLAGKHKSADALQLLVRYAAAREGLVGQLGCNWVELAFGDDDQIVFRLGNKLYIEQEEGANNSKPLPDIVDGWVPEHLNAGGTGQ